MSTTIDQEGRLQQSRKKLSTLRSYEYKTLPGVDFIRILEISPGKGDDEICCRLHVTSLVDAEDTYEAISYVWGDPGELARIFVDGRAINVIINLADALRFIRHPKEVKLVWADAICINQSDDTEKGHQVKRMGIVYENAKGVLVWLGKDSEGIAEDCFNLIQDTNVYLNAQFERYGEWGRIPNLTSQSSISTDRSRWEKVLKLMNLTWFSRLWVIQEAALAKRCYLMWGRQQINIADICEISVWVSLREDLSDIVGRVETGKVFDYFFGRYCSYDNIKHWREDRSLIRHFRKEQKSNVLLFLAVLDLGRHTEVSFDIDRVYAFLGNPLARKGDKTDELILAPDYSKTEDEVYLETACALLEHAREAPYLLTFVEHHSEQCLEGHDFPSWVPRWNKGWRQYPVCSTDYWFNAGELDREFKASAQRHKSLLLTTVKIRKKMLFRSSKLRRRMTLCSSLSGFLITILQEKGLVFAKSINTGDSFTVSMLTGPGQKYGGTK
jgi:hypothetical protein